MIKPSKTSKIVAFRTVVLNRTDHSIYFVSLLWECDVVTFFFFFVVFEEP